MARWKYQEGDSTDKLAKVDKIRRGNRSHKKPEQAREPFELPLDDWDLTKEWFRARVVEVHKKYAFVSPEPVWGDIKTRDVMLATVARRHLENQKRERNLIAVGDIVRCRPTEPGEIRPTTTDLPTVVIQNRAPRVSRLARTDPMNAEIEHVLACNLDQLLIVASFLQPRVKFGLIDRYLTLAEEQRLPAVIILNKLDLLEDCERPDFVSYCEEMIALYRKLGYQVITLSTLDSDLEQSASYDDLKSILGKKISICSGHSGVGKSSVVNLFDPEIVQEVEEDPDIFYKGRHTTTYASFIKLKALDGYVIDTPGIRSFLVGKRSSIELTDAFREMRPYLGLCKYRECRHIDEPDCRIAEAVNSGEIHQDRYKSYRTLLLGETGREGRSGLLNSKLDDDLEESDS